MDSNPVDENQALDLSLQARRGKPSYAAPFLAMLDIASVTEEGAGGLLQMLRGS